MNRPAVANLADLARIAGVSTSTVSRALAGSPMIGVATRERINALAREHGFKLNQMARNLRLKRSQAIGVVLPLGHEIGQPISDPFFILMLGYLADALTERGYDLLLTRVIPTDEDWLDVIVDSGRIDGAIVIGQSDQIAALDRTARRYGPLVVWGEARVSEAHCTVGTDNQLGGKLATRHLLSRGRRKLAFFGNISTPELAWRYAGFRGALEEAGLDASAAPVLSAHFTAEDAYAMIADFLMSEPHIDGIVCGSDVVAMGAIRALAERRLRVPEDVAIVGYDDVGIAAQTNPPLTTIRQDIRRAAGMMVELLFRRMAGEEPGSVVIPPELVIRKSAP